MDDDHRSCSDDDGEGEEEVEDIDDSDDDVDGDDDGDDYDDDGDDDDDGDGDAVGLQVYRCVGLVSEPSSSPPWRPGFLNSGLIIMIMMSMSIMMSMMTMMMMRMAVMMGEYWLFCVIFLFKQAICEDDVNEDGDLL